MKPRRLTFTCKPEGDSLKHDMVYRVMNLLPKGYRSDFLVEAIYDFILKNNGVQVIKRKNCVSILPIGMQGMVSPDAAQVQQISHESEQPLRQPVAAATSFADDQKQAVPSALTDDNTGYQIPREDDEVNADPVKKGMLAWFDDEDYK